MADDWRVELDVEDHDAFHRAMDADGNVIAEAVSRVPSDPAFAQPVDGDRIFAYTETREEAQRAASVLTELAQDHHLAAHATIARWHPEEERWEPQDAPPAEPPAEP
jgi:hypothetical protein